MEEPNCNQISIESTKSDELPQCKIKRNYSCAQCSYFTQNPRFYLTHLREIHGEKIKINNCNLCLYASRHYQKLVRHMKMVHGSTADAIPGQSKKRILPEDVISDSYPPLLPLPSKWTFDMDSLSYDLKSSRNTLKDIAALYFATEEFKPFLARMEESDVVEVVPLQNSFVPFEACNKLVFDDPQNSLYKAHEENFTCVCGHFSKCLAESVAHKKFCILSKESQDVAPLDLSLGSKKSEIGSEFYQPNKSDGPNLVSMGSDWEKTSDVNVEHAGLEMSVTEFEKGITLTEKFKVERSESEKSQQISTSEEFSYKKVFKCSRCSFWASTASRFHVHIVGHHNKKPFKCSLCAYRSNWRWDITKHIRLRTIRSPSHKNARVIIYGDTGEEKDYNYAKYSNYMTFIKIPRGSKLMKCGEMPSSPKASSTDFDKEIEKTTIYKETLKLNKQDTFLNDRTTESPLTITNVDTASTLMAHERLLLSNGLKQNNPRDYLVSSFLDGDKNVVFKCSKCSFKHANRDAVLVHIKVLHQDLLSSLPTSSHAYSSSSLIQDDTTFSKTDLKVKTEAIENSSTMLSNKCSLVGEENSSDLLEIDIEDTKKDSNTTLAVKETTLAMSCLKKISQANENDKPFSNNEAKGSKILSPFRCWHCRQESNWKHVIQRHCRLKHSGDIRIESLDRNSDAPVYRPLELGGNGQSCHVLGPSVNHTQNALIHNNNNNNVLNKDDHYAKSDSPVNHEQKYKPEIPLNHIEITRIPLEGNLSAYNTNAASNKCKQQKCPSCPYTSESKSQMNYHISLHKPTQYECNLCSYVCTKKQHLSNHVKAMHESGGHPRSKQSNKCDDEEMVSKVISYCPKCPTRFVNSLTNLKQHLKGHGASLEYKCKACDYSTKQEATLLSHSFVHTSAYQVKIETIGKCAKEDAEYPAQKVEQISFPKTGETVFVVADIAKDFSTSYKNFELLPADDEANKGKKPMAVVSKCDVKNQENTEKAEKEKSGPSTSRSSLRLGSRSSIQNEERKSSPPLALPSSHKTILVNPKTGQVIRKN